MALSPYFDYFVDLYQPLLHTRTKLELLIKAVNELGSCDKFLAHIQTVCLSTFSP